MKDVYEDLPKLKIELTLSRFFVIIVTILVFFVLPATYVQNYNSSHNTAQSSSSTSGQTQGQVAGVSTQKQESQNNFLGINLNDSNQLLVIIGGVLILVSLAIIIFLIVENYNIKKHPIH